MLPTLISAASLCDTTFVSQVASDKPQYLHTASLKSTVLVPDEYFSSIRKISAAGKGDQARYHE